MSMFLVTMVFIFLILNNMQTNEQTNAPDDSEATDIEKAKLIREIANQ